MLKIRPLVVSLFALGFVTPVVYGQPSDQQVIDTLTHRTQTLEAEVHELQTELEALKHVPVNAAGQPPKYIVVVHKHAHRSPSYLQRVQNAQNPQTSVAGDIQALDSAADNPNQGPTMMARPVAGNPPGIVPLSLLVNAPLTLGGMPVVTSPYLGIRSEFDASDLVSNFPNVNLAFRLLQQRQKIENIFRDNHQPYPDSPFVDLSGTVQPAFFISRPYKGPTVSNIDLPTASLDAMANINRWVMSFIRFSYDNNPPSSFIPAQFGPVISNSRVFLDQGFITIGNLNCSPFYFTMGQIFAPFGKYSTNMISSTLPQLLFRVKARAVMLGFYKELDKAISVSAQGFAFRGDTHFSRTESRVNNGGANLDFAFNFSKLNGMVGASWIGNVADSLGMQLTGASLDGFAGFGAPLPVAFGPLVVGVDSQLLVHRVPGVDVHGSFNIGNFGMLGEYTTATTDFSPLDITYNCRGARPQASYVEAVYNFKICNLPANVAVGYQQTNEALAFLLPKHRYLGTFNISLWKDTVESIEYRHDINYDCGNFATGRGVPVILNGLGHSSDTVTAQIAVYF